VKFVDTHNTVLLQYHTKLTYIMMGCNVPDTQFIINIALLGFYVAM